jgi:hypothetical protein
MEVSAPKNVNDFNAGDLFAGLRVGIMQIRNRGPRRGFYACGSLPVMIEGLLRMVIKIDSPKVD